MLNTMCVKCFHSKLSSFKHDLSEPLTSKERLVNNARPHHKGFLIKIILPRMTSSKGFVNIIILPVGDSSRSLSSWRLPEAFRSCSAAQRAATTRRLVRSVTVMTSSTTLLFFTTFGPTTAGTSSNGTCFCIDNFN